jgi:ADP-glucose pyrophosphorylase
MPYIASMGIYVFSKDVMLKLLRDQFPGANDFGSEVIPDATDIGMRVCGVHRNFSCLFSSDHYCLFF